MLHVAIVGDHGSGKTTFLGLLYAALVSSGSGKGNGLRFHVAYDSFDEISSLYQRLMSGGFPDAAGKEGVRELRVEVPGPATKGGLLHRHKPGSDGTSRTIRFTLPGSLEEATAGLHRGATFGTGAWRDALDADVLVILVDCARIAPATEGSESGPMAAVDDRVAALLVAIQRWRSGGGRAVLYPVFVLSKFDAIPSAVLKAANLEANPPDLRKSEPRATYAEAILGPYLPRTLAVLRGPKGKKLRFAPPSYVFTRVRTETKGSPPQAMVGLRRTESGGWEPDYSRNECLAFLEDVGQIAAATKE